MDRQSNLSLRGSLFVKPDVLKTFDTGGTTSSYLHRHQNPQRQQILSVFRKPVSKSNVMNNNNNNNNDSETAQTRVERRVTIVDLYPPRDSLMNSNTLKDMPSSSSSSSSNSSSSNNSPRGNNSDMGQYYDVIGSTYSASHLSIPPQQLELINEKALLQPLSNNASTSSTSPSSSSPSSTPISTATSTSSPLLDIYGYEVDKIYENIELSKSKSNNIVEHFHRPHDACNSNNIDSNSNSIHRVRLFGYKGGWIGGYGPHGKGNLRFCFPNNNTSYNNSSKKKNNFDRDDNHDKTKIEKSTNDEYQKSDENINSNNTCNENVESDNNTSTTLSNDRSNGNAEDEKEKIYISIKAIFDHGNYFVGKVPLSLISTEGVIDSSFINQACNNSGSASDSSSRNTQSLSTTSVPFASISNANISANSRKNTAPTAISSSNSSSAENSNEIYVKCYVNALTGIVKMVAFVPLQNISNVKLREKETVIDTSLLAPIVHIGTFDWYTKSHITGTINNSVAKFKRIQSLVILAKKEISILENVLKLSTAGKLFIFEKNSRGKIQMEIGCRDYMNEYDIEKIASLFDCHSFTIHNFAHKKTNSSNSTTGNSHADADGSNHFAAIPSLLFYGRFQVHQRIIHNVKALNYDFQIHQNKFYYKVETPNYYNDYDEAINTTGAKYYYIKISPLLRQAEIKKRIKELNQFCIETMIR